MNKILIVGGGTAGHIYPGISLANFFLKQDEKTNILFITSLSDFETQLMKKENFKYKSFELYGIIRKLTIKNIFINIKSIILLIKSLFSCYKTIKNFNPNFIISTGSYVSFNVLLIAIYKKIPFYLLESNALPGLITKIFYNYAKKIFINFDICKTLLNNKKNIIKTGIPLRKKLSFNNISNENSSINKINLPIVTSFFGSLGSSSMNKKIFDYLSKIKDNDNFIHIHITGHKEFHHYENKIVSNKIIIKKYIHNIYNYINKSTIIICRAGSTTLSEIAFFKKPAIIIPSPYVAENHQKFNALEYEKNKSIILIDENKIDGDILYSNITNLLKNKIRLKKMRQSYDNYVLVNNSEAIIYEEIIKA